jgi:hypothetical protein
MRAALTLVAFVALMLLPRAAQAFERGQGFGVDTGVAILSVSDGYGAEMGVSYGLHYSIRLTDQFDFIAQAGGAVVDLDPQNAAVTVLDRPQFMWSADAGVIYKLDIVQFVPYFGAVAGGYMLQGGNLPSALILPGAGVVVGADYLLSRRWAVGLAIQEHFLFTDMGTYPSYLTVAGRFEVTWGGI